MNESKEGLPYHKSKKAVGGSIGTISLSAAAVPIIFRMMENNAPYEAIILVCLIASLPALLAGISEAITDVIREMKRK